MNRRNQPSAKAVGRPGRHERERRTGAKSSQRPLVSPQSPRKRKRRAFRFVLSLFGLFAVFNAWFIMSFAKGETFRSFLSFNARAAAAVLALCGEDASSDGVTVASSKATLTIRHGCDAAQLMAFFVISVALWPSSAGRAQRLAGIGIGVCALWMLNLGRIVSLYYVRLIVPAWFETVHIGVWQPASIVATLLAWALWHSWSSKPPKATPADA